MCDYRDPVNGHPCAMTTGGTILYPYEGRELCEFHLPLEGTGSKHFWTDVDKRRFARRVNDLLRSSGFVDLSGIQIPSLPADCHVSWRISPSVTAVSLRFAVIDEPFTLEQSEVSAHIDATGCIFRGDFSFSNAIATGTLNFREAQFRRATDFTARWLGLTSLHGAHVAGPLTINLSRFSDMQRDAVHDWSDFRADKLEALQINGSPQGLNLSGATLAGARPTIFCALDLLAGHFTAPNLTLHGSFAISISGCASGIDLSGLMAAGPLVVSGRPSGHMQCGDADFHGSVRLEGFTPSRSVTFSASTFHDEVALDQCTFQDHVSFDGASFGSSVVIGRTTFEKVASLRRAHFAKGTYCDAVFAAGVSFQGARVDGDLNLGGAMERRVWAGLDLSDANIYGHLQCSRIDLSGPLDLSRAILHQAPLLADCLLRSDCRFPPLENFRDTVSAHAEDAYRILRHIMEAQRNHAQEGVFFVLEQRSRRRSKALDPIERALSCGYDALALYGQSVSRPLFALAALTMLAGLGYGAAASPSIGMETLFDLGTLAAGFEHSMQQLFLPFRVWSTEGAMRAAWSSLPVKLLATLQSLASLGLITCGLIAIRWRFRRG